MIEKCLLLLLNVAYCVTIVSLFFFKLFAIAKLLSMVTL